MNEMQTKGLSAALVDAQRRAEAVEKTAQNSFHRYAYASSEAVIQVARRALGEAGLAVSAHYAVEHLEPHEMLAATYVLDHLSGESRSYSSSTPIIPEKGRPADKALAAAKTYDLAYFLRALLLLPRVEEGAEVDARDDSQHVPPPAPSQARQRAQAEARRIGGPKAREVMKQMYPGRKPDSYTDAEWAELGQELAQVAPMQEGQR